MQKVTIVRSFNRSALTIQIVSATEIKVLAPKLVPKFYIDKLLRDKADWIETQQQKLKAHEVRKASDEYLYLGKSYPLEIRQQQRQLVEVADKIYVASSNRKYAKTYLMSWYKQQARKIIVERVKYYAEKAGLHYKSIALTSATTRWGSCSSSKTLNFNWKLIMAPMEVIDYVVIHELAHLTEMNHSREFWETVRKMYPLYREYRTWLKRHGHTLTI